MPLFDELVLLCGPLMLQTNHRVQTIGMDKQELKNNVIKRELVYNRNDVLRVTHFRV